MAIILNTPEVIERALAAAARERGVSSEQIALEAIEEYVTAHGSEAEYRRPAPLPPREPRLSVEEFLRNMAKRHAHLTAVPEEYLRREYYYDDPE